MKTASTQLGAVTELRHGRPVIYEGFEIAAPPEDQRSHRKARAWLLERLAEQGYEPTLGQLDRLNDTSLAERGGQVQLTGEQIARLDELAEAWRCNRDEAAQRVVDAGLEATAD